MEKEKLLLDDGKTDLDWLRSQYCSDSYMYGDGKYIQTTYDPVTTHALYGVLSKNRDTMKEILKENKGITRIRMIYANSKEYTIICFKYNSQKDQIRYPQLIKNK